MNREERNVEHRARESGGTAAGRIVSVIFTILVLLLLFRVAFMALGANASNAFVSVIYQITNVMVAPFKGIFGEVDPGTGGTVEPAALIAIVVAAVLGMILSRLLTPSRGRAVHETNVREEEYREPPRTPAADEPHLTERRVVKDREVRQERVAEEAPAQEHPNAGREQVIREREVHDENLEQTRRIPRDDNRRD